MRQYDADEAGDYGDVVPVKSVLLERLHNSRFGYKVKVAAGVLLKTQRNAETQSQRIQHVSKCMDIRRMDITSVYTWILHLYILMYVFIIL